jgi:hypothetical protein
LYVPQLTEEYRGHMAAAREGGQYIYQLHITNEYIFIFFGTEEYKELYSSALRSSVLSTVNQGVYPIFLNSTAIFIGWN